MGYRSEVALAIRAGVEIPPEVQAALDAIFEEPKRTAAGALYHNGWCKWYTHDMTNYPEPTTIYRWLEDLEMEDYFLMRLGEDDGDMDEDGDWHEFDIGYTRHLTCGGKRFDEVAS